MYVFKNANVTDADLAIVSTERRCNSKPRLALKMLQTHKVQLLVPDVEAAAVARRHTSMNAAYARAIQVLTPFREKAGS